jgi:hypothetical protein
MARVNGGAAGADRSVETYRRKVKDALERLSRALRIAVETTPSILLMANFRSCVPSELRAGSATSMAEPVNVALSPFQA